MYALVMSITTSARKATEISIFVKKLFEKLSRAEGVSCRCCGLLQGTFCFTEEGARKLRYDFSTVSVQTRYAQHTSFGLS